MNTPSSTPQSASAAVGQTTGAAVIPQTDPLEVLRSRSYLGLLGLAAVLGIPISAAAYGFLALVGHLQQWIFADLPKAFGFQSEPLWWPLPALVLAGLLVGLTIKHLPGAGGHSPAEGFKTGVAPSAAELPGVVLAALATLSLGVVLGPEAPLIAIGAGLAVLVVRSVRRNTPPPAMTIIGAAGSFAAISTLLGSPLLAAFLLMEVSGLGGAMLTLALLPGLLGAGVGSLVFVGLNRFSGFGTFSLAVPNLPHVGAPNLAEFGWAVAIGLLAVPLGLGIRQLALILRARVERRLILLTPLVGMGIAGLAMTYALTTGRGSTEVLFSGQSALGPLIANAASYSEGALLALIACKGLAYGLSLSSFRGGPIFPALFLGAAGGIALSHLPGLHLVASVGMGMGAMSAVMLKLPMTSVLLPALFLQADGLAVMPMVIVAVVVAYVAAARLEGAFTVRHA